MINFKPQIRLNQINSEGKCNIKIRVSHQRKTRYISTNLNVFPNQFNNKKGIVKEKEHPNAKFINIELQKIVLSYENKTINITPKYDIKQVLDLINGKDASTIDFYQVIQNKIDRLKELGKAKTAESNLYTKNSVKAYTKLKQLDFRFIDYKWLTNFEVHLTKNGLKVNAIGIHMRNIRAVYNEAIDNNIIELNYYPFRRFKIKSEKTAKRNLSVEQLKSLKEIEITGRESYIRDMFFLSFYLIGINSKDMYYLSEMRNGRINYRRAKTGKLYDIKLLPEAIDLIEKYRGTKHLLNCSDLYVDHLGYRKAISKFMKRIATRCEIPELITSYFARHSWATIASSLDIPKETISAALGHGQDTVTDIYINYDTNKVDIANELVCQAIK